MTKVTMEYLQANGRRRKATAHTESQWPNFLINHEDKQAHSLMDSPVFSAAKGPRFRSWEELLSAPPPEAEPYPDKLICVCEDQNIWPISNEMMPDPQDRQMQFKEFSQDAEQNAVTMATRDSANSKLMNAWAIISMTVFAIVSLMVLLVAMQSDMAKDIRGNFHPLGPSAAMLFMVGGLSFRRKKGEPKPERFRSWETLRVYDELAGFPWSCSMPLKILQENLPLDCRYTDELWPARKTAMAFWGGIFYAGGIIPALMFGWPIMATLTLPLLIAPLGILFGWKKGYERFVIPPTWIVRRVFKQIEVEPGQYQIDYDSLPEVIPEVHSKLNNMPLPMAQATRRAEVDEVIKQMESKSNGGNGSSATAVLTKQNLAIAYTPRIWRAYVLYEMLRGRDIRSRMKGPAAKGDKLMKLSFGGMALASMGILVVALLLFGG